MEPRGVRAALALTAEGPESRDDTPPPRQSAPRPPPPAAPVTAMHSRGTGLAARSPAARTLIRNMQISFFHFSLLS